MIRLGHFILIGFFLTSACCADTATVPAVISADKLSGAMQRGVDYLYKAQKHESWEFTAIGDPGGEANQTSTTGPNRGGQTAVAVWALLSAGENPTDPRLAPAIDFLKKADIVSTYSLGIRCQVMTMLPPKPDVLDILRQDSNRLLSEMRTKGKALGFYGYVNVKDPLNYDHSSSQFAVLGLSGCAEAGIEIPPRYWELVNQVWRQHQEYDRGWGYTLNGNQTGKVSSASMTSTLAEPSFASMRAATLLRPAMRWTRLQSVPCQPHAKQLALGSPGPFLTPKTSGLDLPPSCFHGPRALSETTQPLRFVFEALWTPNRPSSLTTLSGCIDVGHVERHFLTFGV